MKSDAKKSRSKRALESHWQSQWHTVAARAPAVLLASLAILLLFATTLAHAENWPGWRGPNRDGITADRGVPLRWSATEDVAWKARLPGAGSSNPIVWGDRVFVTASEGPKHDELHLVSLSLKTGAVLWDRRFWGTSPTLYHATKSSMASPSPTTDGQFVYAMYGTGDIFCFDFAGRLQWQRSLAAEYGPFENRFAASSSPLLVGEQLIVQCDHYGASYLIAIDKRTGANRWKADRPDAWLSWSSPQLATAAATGEQELIVCGSERIDAYAPATGQKLWTLPGLTRECIPTPVVAHNLIFAVSGPRGTSYAIAPGGRGNVSTSHVKWTSTRGTPFVPSGIVVGDYYYLVDDRGIATCIEALTGKVRWRQRLGGAFTASPVSAEGRIYFVNEDGSTLVIRGGAAKYEELARNEIGEPVYASPAIAQGKFLVRTVDALWCIEPK